MFTRLKDKRLFEMIVDQIKENIASGGLKPGDKLPPETEMARLFGVSRAAVREALRTLELAGLVTIKLGNKGGCFIQKEAGSRTFADHLSDSRRLGNVTFADLAEARYWLESIIIGIVGQKGTGKDLARLRKSIEGAERLYKEGREIEKIDEQFDFHLLLARITGNSVLVDMMAVVIDLLKYMMIKTKPDHRITIRTFEDHRKIVELLEDGLVEEAKEAAKDHIVYVNDLLNRKYARQVHLSRAELREPMETKAADEAEFERIVK